jgi:hypothetical protein
MPIEAIGGREDAGREDARASAARALPDHEALLRAIVETSPDGLITIDGAGVMDFGLSTGQRCRYSVEAVTPTILVRYPRPRLEAALAAEPELAQRMFRIACIELERAPQHLLLLGRKRAEEKVAALLLTLARRLGDGHDRRAAVHLPMSRQDMADYLGLTIGTVSRTLTRLRRAGLIGLPTPQQVVLIRADALSDLAEGDGSRSP